MKKMVETNLKILENQYEAKKTAKSLSISEISPTFASSLQNASSNVIDSVNNMSNFKRTNKRKTNKNLHQI